MPGPTSLAIEPTRRDPKLLALLGEAINTRKLVIANERQSLNAIAAAQGRCLTRLGRLVAISCLPPDIVTAIVEGKQPEGMTAKALLDADLPMGWDQQRRMLGVG